MVRILTAQELEMGREVLKDVVGQSWFEQTDDNEAAVANLIVRTMQTGLIEREALRLACARSARQNFSCVDLSPALTASN